MSLWKDFSQVTKNLHKNMFKMTIEDLCVVISTCFLEFRGLVEKTVLIQ